MRGEFLNLRLVLRFGVREVGGEFLNLRLVLRFGVREVGGEFLDLRLVLRFRVREVGSEFLDLRLVLRLPVCATMRAEFLHFRSCVELQFAQGARHRDARSAQSGLERRHRAGSPRREVNRSRVTSNRRPDFATDVFLLRVRLPRSKRDKARSLPLRHAHQSVGQW